jgi:hypothetical protein
MSARYFRLRFLRFRFLGFRFLGPVFMLSVSFMTFAGQEVLPALADGGETVPLANDSFESVQSPEVDAKLDKRLPPVIPGESVAKNGKSMKVWSTGGELASQKPPSPEGACRKERNTRTGEVSEICASEGLPQGLGVVVDGRVPTK